MQNAECIMQNDGVGVADGFKMIAEGNSTILHSAFCILHLSFHDHGPEGMADHFFRGCLRIHTLQGGVNLGRGVAQLLQSSVRQGGIVAGLHGSRSSRAGGEVQLHIAAADFVFQLQNDPLPTPSGSRTTQHPCTDRTPRHDKETDTCG